MNNSPPRTPKAILFDRDGTLVVDVPYNGDPTQVRLMPGVRRTLDRIREGNILIGVVSNQSGVARNYITAAQVEQVNARIAELAGPIDGWFTCPHGPDDSCACRKPLPGLIFDAAAQFRVEPQDCVVIGDIGADVAAARAAGARSILVPTSHTRAEEIEQAPEVAPSLGAAVDKVLPT